MRLRFQTLERRSLRDPETQAYTQAYFEDAVRNEIHKANRFSHRFSLLRIDADVDGAGDDDPGASPLDVARVVACALRTTDVLASDEDGVFSVLLPQTDALGAGILAERIRRALSSLQSEGSSRGSRTVGVSYPVDGVQLETLMHGLDERVADARNGLLARRSDLLEIQALDPFLDRLLELGDVQPVEIEGQILRFVLEDLFRRPGDRGVLILSPGTRWLADVLESFHDTRGRESQTEIVMLADGAARSENPEITWISKSSLDDRRPFLVYYGEGPAFAMVGSATSVGARAPIFQTADRCLVEHLAFELQRELGILISV